MLHLNLLTIPDPAHPEKFDAYGIERPELIVYAVHGSELLTIVCAFRGSAISLPADMLGAFLVSVGFRPLGRLEQRERGVKARCRARRGLAPGWPVHLRRGRRRRLRVVQDGPGP